MLFRSDSNPNTISAFLTDYEASIAYSVEQVEDAAVLTEEFGIVNATVATKAIPHCNLTFLSGEDMKTALSGYLEVLYAQNEASVGKALPDDGFYYLP